MTAISLTRQPISLTDFTPGQTLTGTILDGDGNVLFREGLTLTAENLAAWQRRGSGPFFQERPSDDLFDASTVKTDDATSESSSHSRESFGKWFGDFVMQWEELASNLTSDQPISLRNLEGYLDSGLELFCGDPALTLYHVLTADQVEVSPASQPKRAAYLVALSGVVAREYGMSHEDCFKVALAAALHDIALYPPLLLKLQEAVESEEEKLDVVFRHGMISSELITARANIPELVRVVIHQVHEQMDGSGAPRGLPGHLINVMARVINLADALLSLIAVADGRAGYVTADAIAYLVHHTSHGAFDRDCMRALLGVATLYGIGTRVLLEDDRQATVVRAVPGAPLHPVVSLGDTLLDAESVQEDQYLLNLAELKLNIVGPAPQSERARRSRIPRSRMDQVLWVGGQ